MTAGLMILYTLSVFFVICGKKIVFNLIVSIVRVDAKINFKLFSRMKNYA